MHRDLDALASREHDLVVVGGGIVGVCAAWDAALRGLSVALVERGDFGHATSASCFKMVHGGIRYLQHGDLPRVRESSRERRILLRVAPHLVQPLPIVVPTYGHGARGRALLRAGLLAYDALTLDRNRGIADPGHRIPRSRLLSRDECLALFPWLRRAGLTGAGLFHDAHMHSPARLALAFLRSAVEAGAVAANHVEAVALVRRGTRVCGVRVRDGLGGDLFEVRGRVVLNAAGPWAEQVLAGHGLRLEPPSTFSRDAYLIVPGRLTGDHAIALPATTRDPDAILSRGPRHLFLVPWRNRTLVGVWHVVHRGHPEAVAVTGDDVRAFLAEVNTLGLPVRLGPQDVCGVHAGLVLFGENRPGAVHLRYGKRSRLVDHRRDGVDGLISLVGVRYTTARGVAARAVDLVLAQLGRRGPASTTAATPLHGGRIEHLDAFVGDVVARRPAGLPPAVLRDLVRDHGTTYPEVLRHAEARPALAETIGTSTVIGAQVVHAARDEMAVRLGDVVFRRTHLAGGGSPGDVALHVCADLMAAELDWTPARRERELADVRSRAGLASLEPLAGGITA